MSNRKKTTKRVIFTKKTLQKSQKSRVFHAKKPIITLKKSYLNLRKSVRLNYKNLKKSARTSVKHLKKSSKTPHKYFQTIAKSNPMLVPSLIVALSIFAGIIIGHTFLPIATSVASENYQLQIEESSSNHYSLKKTLEVPEKSQAQSNEIATAYYTRQITNYVTSQINSTATSTTTNAASSGLSIPALGISSPLISSSLSNNELSVPDYGVSVYGSLYMGHSSGVFAKLPSASVGQNLQIGSSTYIISSVQNYQPVWANRKGVGNYSMRQLINLGENQVVLMTCSGSYQAGFGWTHRTLVFATLSQ